MVRPLSTFASIGALLRSDMSLKAFVGSGGQSDLQAARVLNPRCWVSDWSDAGIRLIALLSSLCYGPWLAARCAAATKHLFFTSIRKQASIELLLLAYH